MGSVTKELGRVAWTIDGPVEKLRNNVWADSRSKAAPVRRVVSEVQTLPCDA